MHEAREYTTCISQGGLSILVADKRVVRIVDWELAEWFPINLATWDIVSSLA